MIEREAIHRRRMSLLNLPSLDLIPVSNSPGIFAEKICERGDEKRGFTWRKGASKNPQLKPEGGASPGRRKPEKPSRSQKFL